MFIPGKPELMLGCTEWLNRRNAHTAWPRLFAALGLLLAAAGAWRWRRPWPETLPMLLAAGSVGLFAGVAAVSAANRAAYPPPAPHTRCRTICFDRQCSHFELPDRTLFLQATNDFSTFYVWVQRVGFVPRVCPKLADSTRQDDGLAMINPSGPLSQSDLLRLRAFVERGGILYLLDSPGNKASNANQILGMFDAALGDAPAQSLSISNAAGQLVALDQYARVTKGGVGLLFAGPRTPVLATMRAGKGAVIFSGDAELFANATLGVVSQVPDETQRRLYDLIFQLFRQAGPHAQPGRQ
jgi:hypothetical protein